MSEGGRSTSVYAASDVAGSDWSVPKQLNCPVRVQGSNPLRFHVLLPKPMYIIRFTRREACVGAVIAVLVTGAAATALPAPTGVAAASNVRGGIDVSWDAVGGADYYQVTTSASGSPAGDVPPVLETYATSAVLSGLTLGATYTASVVAMPAAGDAVNTASSPAVSSAALSRTPPDAVSSVYARAAAVGDTDVTVTWFAPDGNGAPVTQYDVAIEPGVDSFTVTDGSMSHTFAVTGFADGGGWTATVVARNEAGDSAVSAPVEVLAPATDWRGIVRVRPLSLGGEHSCVVLGPDALSFSCWGYNNNDQLGHSDAAFVVDASAHAAISMAGQVVLQLALGESHTCVLTDALRAYCFGLSSSGRLGRASSGSTPFDSEVDFGGDVIDISAGAAHTCAVLLGGAVRCAGLNSEGRLGTGSTSSVTNAAVDGVVDLPEAVTSVTCGDRHTCALGVSRRPLCWGGGGFVGDGSTSNALSPVYVVGVDDVAVLEVGHDYSCALKHDTSLLCWGAGKQSGHGGSTLSVSPQESFPVHPPALAGFVDVAQSEETPCALLENGAFTCWGEGANGRLGTGTTNDRFAPVDAGELRADGGLAGVTRILSVQQGGSHGCVMTGDLRVQCFGSNTRGAASTGDTSAVMEPTIDATLSTTAQIPSPRVVRVTGCNEFGLTSSTTGCPSAGGATLTFQLASGLPHTSIAPSAAVTVAIGAGDAECTSPSYDTAEQTVSCTAPSIATAGPHLVRVTVVDNDGVFLTVDSTVHEGAATVSYLTAAEEGAGPVVAHVTGCAAAVGARTIGCDPVAATTLTVHGHAFGTSGATVAVGGVACTDVVHVAGFATTRLTCTLPPGSGSNLEVRVTADSSESPVGAATVSYDDFSVEVVPVAAWGSTTCVVEAGSRQARCWGEGDEGQTGVGLVSVDAELASAAVPMDTGSTAVLQVAVGDEHTCVLLASRSARCVGAADNGRLGLGAMAQRVVRMAYAPDIDVGGDVVQVVAGTDHSCVLRHDGHAFCFGRGSAYRLGTGTTDDVWLAADGVVDFAEPFSKLAVGEAHGCGVTESQRLVCWGEGDSFRTGQLVTADVEVPTLVPFVAGVQDVALGGTSTCVLFDKAGAAALRGRRTAVRCVGSDSAGQLGVGDTVDNVAGFASGVDAPFAFGRDPVTIECGYQHCCTKDTSGDGVCFGQGQYGKLLSGATSNIGAPEIGQPIDLGTGQFAMSFSPGFSSTCVVRKDLSLLCAGLGSDGRLGVGSTASLVTFDPDDDTVPLGGGLVHPPTPRVRSVSGCVDVGATTVDCPSAGGTRLRIQLTSGLPDSATAASAELLVRVGGELCTDVDYIADSEAVSCTAPAIDSDEPQLVSVRVWDSGVFGTLQSVDRLALATVSYLTAATEAAGVPVVSSVSGCGGRVDTKATACSASTVTVLEVRGSNFGTGDVDVVVGGQSCLDASHNANSPTNLVTCNLQPGEGADLSVVVVTDAGTSVVNDNVTVSFDDYQVARVPVSVRLEHSCAILQSGNEVHCFGHADEGQTGNGDHEHDIQFAPHTDPLVFDEDALQVSVSTDHTCVLFASNRVKCWGKTASGRTGVGDVLTTALYANAAPYLDFGWDVLQIVTGDDFSCALLLSGVVHCFGEGARTGTGSTDDVLLAANGAVDSAERFIYVDAGEFHACGVTVEHKLACWGVNTHGQLGTGDDTVGITALSPTLAVGVTDALYVAMGGSFTCILRVSGAVRCAGSSGSGELGYGGTSSFPEFSQDVEFRDRRVGLLSLGTSHACAVTHSSAVACWGARGNYRQGSGSNSGAVTAPVDEPAIQGVAALEVAAAGAGVCFVDTDLTLRCAGRNDWGQLGFEDTAERATPEVTDIADLVLMPSPRVLSVTGCDDDVPGLLAGTGRCPSAGGTLLRIQLASSFPSDSVAPGVAVSVTVGGEQCDDVTVDVGLSRLTCRAPGIPGGAGPHVVQVSLTHVVFGTVRSVDRLTPALVHYLTADEESSDAPLVSSVSGCSATVGTAAHACGTSGATALRIMGSNFGVGTVSVTVGDEECAAAAHDADSPTNVVTCELQPGTGVDLPVVVTRAGQNSVADPAVSVSFEDYVVRRTPVAASADTTCAVLSSFRVVCWGRADEGQTGTGTDVDQVLDASAAEVLDFGVDVYAVAVGSNHFCVLTAAKRVRCIGRSSEHQLGLGTGVKRSLVPEYSRDLELPDAAVQIEAAESSTFALLADGRVFAWGQNTANGALGVGHTSHVSAAGGEPLDTSVRAGLVKVSDGFGCLVTSDAERQLYCWGANSAHQLGLGADDNDAKLSPTLVPGATSVVAVALGDDFSCVVQVAHEYTPPQPPTAARCFSSIGDEMLGLGATVSNGGVPGIGRYSIAMPGSGFPVDIVAGNDHACISTNRRGAVSCWSSRSNPAALTTTSHERSPTEAGLIEGLEAVFVAAGDDSTCFVNRNLTLVCVGQGDNGRLGLGSEDDNADLDVSVPLPGPGTLIMPSQSIAAVSGCASFESNRARAEDCSASSPSTVSFVLSVAAPASPAVDEVEINVRVGGQSCSLHDWNDEEQTIVCTLPGSDGDSSASRSVTVEMRASGGTVERHGITSGAVASSDLALVSFVDAVVEAASPPVVTRVLGCPYNTLDSTNQCSLAAGTALTIVGSFFGSDLEPIAVHVDGVPCAAVERSSASPATRITCMLDPLAFDGDSLRAAALPVVVTTDVGSSSSVAAPSVAFVNWQYVANSRPLAVGDGLACVIVGPDRDLRCAGLNTVGQAGVGFANGADAFVDVSVGLRVGEQVVQVALGALHACALLASGSVRCWGERSDGRLGYGVTAPDMRSAAAAPDIELDDGGRRATMVCAAVAHTCVLFEGGGVKCFGKGDRIGQGLSDTAWEPAELPDVPLPRAAVQVSCMSQHTAVLLDDGRVATWGSGANYRLGTGSGATQHSPVLLSGIPAVRQVSAGGDVTCMLFVAGSVRCVGASDHVGASEASGEAAADAPDVELPESDSAVVQVASGGAHSCCLFASGAVYCWGSGIRSQLGFGTTATAVVPAALAVPGAPAQFVATGTFGTCVLQRDARVVCFNSNINGELLLGHANTATTAAHAALKLPVTAPTPRVVRVSGCADVEDEARTELCPAWGNTLLRVFALGGHVLVPMPTDGEAAAVPLEDGTPTVLVGGEVCGIVGYGAQGQIECTLPPTPNDAGGSVGVVVRRAPQWSGSVAVQTVDVNAEAVTVSYNAVTLVAPVVSLVRGCVDLPGEPHTRECPNDSPTRLTLHGFNFGTGAPEDSVTVTVGGAPCGDVVHDTTLPGFIVSCTLAPSDGGFMEIAVSNALGSSTDVTETDSVYVFFALPRVDGLSLQTGLLGVGGEPLTISGYAFGHVDSELPVVAVSGGVGEVETCTRINNTQINCMTPPGWGFDNQLSVTVAGQVSLPGPVSTVSYARPSIDSASVSALGGTLTVRGVNFGGAVPPDAIVIAVETSGTPLSCGNAQWISDGEVRCTFGFGGTEGCSTSTVAVTVAGQTSDVHELCVFAPSVPPSAPTSVTTAILSETSVRVSWSAPEQGEGVTVSWYVVRASTSPDIDVDILERTTADADTTSLEFAELQFGASYYFEVFAVAPDEVAQDGVTGSKARSGTAATLGLPPAAPAGVRGTRGAEFSTIVVEWEQRELVSNVPISSFSVAYARDFDFTLEAVEQVVSDPVVVSAQPLGGTGVDEAELVTYSTTIFGFRANPYFFTVTAANSVGTSPASEVSDPVVQVCHPTLEYLSTDAPLVDWVCVECPDGAFCGGGNHTQITALFGSWRVSWLSEPTFVPCLRGDACLGAANAALEPVWGIIATQTHDEGCSDGYEGPLCGACADRYAPSPDFGCGPCLDPAPQVLVSLLGVALAVAVVVYMIRGTLHGRGKAKNPIIAIVKIFVSFVQVSSLAASFDLEWPGAMTGLFSTMDAVSSVGDDLLHVDCFVTNTPAARRFFVSTLVMILLPFAMVLVSLGVWLVLAKLRGGAQTKSSSAVAAAPTASYSSTTTPTSPAPVADLSLVDKMRTSAIVILFLLHPNLTKQAMKLFTCRTVAGDEDRRYLAFDMVSRCGDEQVDTWRFGLGIPALLVGAIGIPFAAYVWLWLNRGNLGEQRMRDRAGFLYTAFTEEAFYWELVVVTGRKVAFTIVSVFAAPLGLDIQTYLALLVLFAAFGLHIHVRPYANDKLNRLELAGITCSFLTLFGGLFLGSPNVDSGGRIATTLAIFSLNVVVFQLFAWEVFGELRAGQAEVIRRKAATVLGKVKANASAASAAIRSKAGAPVVTRTAVSGGSAFTHSDSSARGSGRSAQHASLPADALSLASLSDGDVEDKHVTGRGRRPQARSSSRSSRGSSSSRSSGSSSSGDDRGRRRGRGGAKATGGGSKGRSEGRRASYGRA